MEEEKAGDGVVAVREESGDRKNELRFYKELECQNCPPPRVSLEKEKQNKKCPPSPSPINTQKHMKCLYTCGDMILTFIYT